MLPTEESRVLELETDVAWHAIYTWYQHEKMVGDWLSKKGFETFLPLYQTTRRWKDRRKTLLLPLFPSYVFIRGGLERQLQIVTTPGVCSLVMAGGGVAVITPDEIDAVKRTVESSLRVWPHPFLKCGDRVRVKSGPLEGIEGVLVRTKGQLRLVISVELLHQAVAIEVDAAAVEQVPRLPANQRWQHASHDAAKHPQAFATAGSQAA